MPENIYNTLFLCTGNSARSIMAEALLNTLGQGRFKADSAGSRPSGHVNPYTLDVLTAAKISLDDVRSKSWDEFAAPDAPQMDFIITLCDSAAGEACPLWPGQPMTAHWGFEDPASANGTDEQKRAAFDKVFRQIANRVKLLANLPLATLDRMAIHRELKAIGSHADTLPSSLSSSITKRD